MSEYEQRQKNFEDLRRRQESILGMSYIKYVQCYSKKWSNSARMIKGVFKNKDGVYENDIFMCVEAGDALESYKIAIDYFNSTLKKYESKREAVSAEWVKGGHS